MIPTMHPNFYVKTNQGYGGRSIKKKPSHAMRSTTSSLKQAKQSCCKQRKSPFKSACIERICVLPSFKTSRSIYQRLADSLPFISRSQPSATSNHYESESFSSPMREQIIRTERRLAERIASKLDILDLMTEGDDDDFNFCEVDCDYDHDDESLDILRESLCHFSAQSLQSQPMLLQILTHELQLICD